MSSRIVYGAAATLSTGDITSDMIGTDVIAAADVAANAIGASELADDAVDTAAIVDDAVTAAKLAIPTTKGNVVVGNGTIPTEVTVGTNDQVLTADSNEATGVKWAAAGGADTNNLKLIVHINDTSAAASVDSGAFTGVEKLLITGVVRLASPGAGAGLLLRINTASEASYDVLHVDNGSAGTDANFDGWNLMDGDSNAQDVQFTCVVLAENAASDAKARILGQAMGTNESTTGNAEFRDYGGFYDGATAVTTITQIQFVADDGSNLTGQVSIYELTEA